MSTRQQPRRDARVPHRGYLLPHGEPIALSDIRDALVIKEGNLFLMMDVDGNVPRNSGAGYGLFKGDTRYLSVYGLTFEESRPVVLLTSAELGFSMEQHLTNRTFTNPKGRQIPKESVDLRRQQVMNEYLLDSIQITNFNIFRTVVNLRFDFAADFADIFEIRGEKRRSRGRFSPPAVEKNRVVFKYEGLDGVWRSTEISFSPTPDQLWYNGALYSVSLGHRESFDIVVRVSLDGVRGNGHFTSEFNRQTASYREWLHSGTQIFTSNEFVNAILERSLYDIRSLMVDERGNGRFVAAGIPWFNCLFGRDSLITSMQMLAFRPEIARDTLRILAQWQGKEVNAWRDEEPGKILHELRSGEMASLGEIPMNPYYGSIDSTLLFIMLAAEYLAWTGDLALVRELESNLTAAMEWIDTYGDADRCGFVEYCKRSPKGLLNQGWKDSRNGIVNGDGTLVKPPIALVEVQGYVYAAKRGMARLLFLLGKDKAARRLRREAALLKRDFNRHFWLEDEGFYALALGANKEPATSITSNPGHCLWTRIIDMDKAPRVVERLFANDMFSGWGIRTLSSQAIRYNPLGYHLGTIWPHDNSLIGMGLKKYSFEDELNELATALYDACRSFDYYRFPELFCGMPRTAHSLPVRYPVACRPQAWAAGTFMLLLRSILGLAPDAPENTLRIVSPRLPYWLEEVEVRRLRVCSSSVDLLYERCKGRTKVSATAKRGVTVAFCRKWTG